MILRNLVIEDAEYIISAWSGNERLLGYGIQKYDREKMKELINTWNTKSIDGKYYEMFAIENENVIIGLLNFYEIDSNSVIIGISIDSLYWRKGYAFQAMQLAFGLLKSTKYNHIVSNCRCDNIASIALHNKCGFKFLCEDISKKSGQKINRYEKYL